MVLLHFLFAVQESKMAMATFRRVDRISASGLVRELRAARLLDAPLSLVLAVLKP
jgi:hypothetical protein